MVEDLALGTLRSREYERRLFLRLSIWEVRHPVSYLRLNSQSLLLQATEALHPRSFPVHEPVPVPKRKPSLLTEQWRSHRTFLADCDYFGSHLPLYR